MKKTKKPDFLLNPDKDARRKSIEEVIRQLDAGAQAAGQRPIGIDSVKARYEMSCMLIMITSVFSTIIMALASAYFVSLPSPKTYATTQDGKLYELKPYKIIRE
jgi:hypothetical protein